ncbi:frizzled-7-like [Lytechinus pictus]|uniref:frizzled-7-like n=1 Tax=Lytechinus pictus TaxID=7653 RepID=UPI00240D403C|nr:frizzled-7-like [Lytechinus pictus]
MGWLMRGNRHIAVEFSLTLMVVLFHFGAANAQQFDYNEGITHGRCEAITIPLCEDMPYNMTIMPNLLNHQHQEDAGLEVHQFYPLVKVQCSEDLKNFLCSMYAPVCTVLDSALPPCKSLCLSAKNGCESLMNKFGFSWPASLSCDQFPEAGLCFDRNRTDERITIPSTKPPNTTKSTEPSVTKNVPFTCPLQLTVDSDWDYTFMRAQNCGAPCNMYFHTPREQNFARYWVGCWAFVCAVSSLFTVLTFLIDRSRFRYPERPIIFLSGCYFVISVVFIAGFFLEDKVACNRPYLPGGESTLVQGAKQQWCTILFMLLYFFQMASCLWWVLLSLTWFLAAGLKWGHEAIERNSQYFHFAAWSIPAGKTIGVLATGQVDGDSLSGVCYTGIRDMNALRGFILAPLFVYLIIGSFFLCAGFIALFRIRTFMKSDGNKTDKLEKLMIRIGIFSLLYTVPATIVIGCYIYEQANRELWEVFWKLGTCHRLSFACPQLQDLPNWFPVEFVQSLNLPGPDYLVFIVKYLMMLIVGITSSVWVWSGKTMRSWSQFYAKLCNFSSHPKGAPANV